MDMMIDVFVAITMVMPVVVFMPMLVVMVLLIRWGTTAIDTHSYSTSEYLHMSRNSRP